MNDSIDAPVAADEPEASSPDESVDASGVEGPDEAAQTPDDSTPDDSTPERDGAEGAADAPEEADAAEEAAVERGPGPGDELDDDELARRVAALLFASPEPLTVARMVALLDRPRPSRVRAVLETLDQQLQASGLPLQVRGLRGGHTLMTTPEVGALVGRLAKGNPIERVSAAALETLAVVAYRQPVTKAEIEAIRGVQAGPILRSLVDRGLIRVTGRAEVPGHPLQYGTTKEFLDRFGLMGIDDLPRDSELARD